MRRTLGWAFLKEAAHAFRELFALGADNHNITIRFLFEVNSVEFVAQDRIRSQDDIWLPQIAAYIANSKRCMTVIGHTAHTGAVIYNRLLSLYRAERIRGIFSYIGRIYGDAWTLRGEASRRTLSEAAVMTVRTR